MRKKFLRMKMSFRSRYDQEMVPKTEDWVERLNPDSKLPNFNTGRILVPKSQVVNESLKVLNTLESSKDFEAEFLTPLPPLDEKVNSNQMSQESSNIQKTESSKSVDSSRMSQDSKPKVQNTGSSKILYCMICKREDHRTSDHEMYIASLNRSENYKAQPYQYAFTSKQILKANAKPFPPCTHYGFSDHRPNDCRNYPECEICRSYDHFTSGHNRVIHIRGGVLAESSQSNESSFRKCLHLLHMDLFGPVSPTSINHKKYTLVIIDEYSRERIPDISYFRVFGYHVFIHNHKDHLSKFDAKVDDEYFLGYSSVSKAFRVYNTRRQQIKETYHVIFDESMKAIRFTNTLVDEIGINDSSRYPSDEFLHEDGPSRQYQIDSDISYYVI
nr:retrovirus-related Pol polyprotein from transposon TNT 1-94 [Tanacetum cinerariifolium]